MAEPLRAFDVALDLLLPALDPAAAPLVHCNNCDELVPAGECPECGEQTDVAVTKCIVCRRHDEASNMVPANLTGEELAHEHCLVDRSRELDDELWISSRLEEGS